VTGLTRSLALDGRPFRIACGQIDIGNAETAIAEAMAKGVPQPDGSVRPEPTMDVGEAARAVAHMASLPLDANVLFMTVMATNMPYVGRG
jgi:NAD(P)-dependent dehydrogenase (short-subunit alcohol dehydrogenase family)